MQRLSGVVRGAGVAVKHVLCVNTGGTGDLHQYRAHRLASALSAEVTYLDVDRSLPRARTCAHIGRAIASRQWDLIYQESTGIAGGLNLIAAAIKRRQRFVVSSGDPVSGYFRVTAGRAAGAVAGLYEAALYRASAGFVGWTPYLAGRALAIGAPRAVTVEGGVDLGMFRPYMSAERAAARARFGLGTDDIVCGVVGSLRWRRAQGYCYGLELVEMAARLRRSDVSVLIVGGGTGMDELERRIPDRLRSRVVLAGRVAPEEVPAAINAMDIGFVTQTVDGLGNFRLTTKLPEYLACGVPVAMSPIPGFYDYVGESGWALPALHPADPELHVQCAQWVEGVNRDDIARRSAAARAVACERFDYDKIARRFRGFVHEIIGL